MHRAVTTAGFAILTALALSTPAGCLRAGFVPTPPDGGPSTDGPAVDLLPPAGLDGDCEAGNGCVAPLVCTGLPGQRICRPPCSKDADCSDSERCGQPVNLQGETLSVPRACLSVALAKRYESCGLSPACEPGMTCVNMPGETFWTFCAETCSDDGDCRAGEACEPELLTSAQGLCLLLCTGDADCPGKLRCTGLGGPPQNRDYCLSINPAGTDAPCNAAMGSPCGARHRCLSAGTSLPSMCVPFCDSLGQCSTGRRCYVDLTPGRDYCMRQCDPAASTCPTDQLCLPHIPTLSAFCIAGQGLPLGSVCGSNSICSDGAFCSSSRCRKVCTGNDDCDAAEACVATTSGAKTLPWKVCKPAGG